MLYPHTLYYMGDRALSYSTTSIFNPLNVRLGSIEWALSPLNMRSGITEWHFSPLNKRSGITKGTSKLTEHTFKNYQMDFDAH